MSDKNNIKYVTDAFARAGAIVERRKDEHLVYVVRYKNYDELYVNAIDESDAFNKLCLVYCTALNYGVFRK